MSSFVILQIVINGGVMSNSMTYIVDTLVCRPELEN
jgi:hypothetical protein